MPLRDALDAIQLIHQAFESGYQGQLQKNKQTSDIELAKQENERRNKELDVHQQEAKANLELHQAQLNQMHFENKAKIMELLRSGALQGNTSGGEQDTEGNATPITKAPVTFNGETVDNYQLPNDVANQQLAQQKTLLTGLAPIQSQIAASQKTAELSAEEPFKVQQSNRETASKLAEQAPILKNQKEIAAAAQEGENKRAQLNASTSMAGHNIAAQTARYVAQANNFMLPEQQDGLNKQALNLFAGIDTTTPTGKPKEAIQMIGTKTGMVLPDKKDIEKLKTIPQAVDTLQMIRKFTLDFGGDSKVQQWAQGKLADTELPSTVKTALDAINTRAIGFSKAFEGTTGVRFTNKDLQLVLGGMVKAGNTSKNNEVLAANLDKMVNNATSQVLTHYSPQQRQLLVDTYGLDDLVDNGGNLKRGITKPLSPLIEKMFEGVSESSKIGGRLQKNKTVENYLKTGQFTPIYK